MKSIIAIATAALALFAAAPVTEAAPCGRSLPRSHVYVSGYRSCGTPVYTERYCIGFRHCGAPIWRYRVVSAPRRVYCAPPRPLPCRPRYTCPPPRGGIVIHGSFRL